MIDVLNFVESRAALGRVFLVFISVPRLVDAVRIGVFVFVVGNVFADSVDLNEEREIAGIVCEFVELRRTRLRRFGSAVLRMQVSLKFIDGPIHERIENAAFAEFVILNALAVFGVAGGRGVELRFAFGIVAVLLLFFAFLLIELDEVCEITEIGRQFVKFRGSFRWKFFAVFFVKILFEFVESLGHIRIAGIGAFIFLGIFFFVVAGVLFAFLFLVGIGFRVFFVGGALACERKTFL